MARVPMELVPPPVSVSEPPPIETVRPAALRSPAITAAVFAMLSDPLESVSVPPLRSTVLLDAMLVVPLRFNPSLLPALLMPALMLMVAAFMVSVVSITLLLFIAEPMVILLEADRVTSVVPSNPASAPAVIVLVTVPP